MAHAARESKILSLVKSSMHPYAREPGWQSGAWLCIFPGLPTHLVQELNVDTIMKLHRDERFALATL